MWSVPGQEPVPRAPPACLSISLAGQEWLGQESQPSPLATQQAQGQEGAGSPVEKASTRPQVHSLARKVTAKSEFRSPAITSITQACGPPPHLLCPTTLCPVLEVTPEPLYKSASALEATCTGAGLGLVVRTPLGMPIPISKCHSQAPLTWIPGGIHDGSSNGALLPRKEA